MAGRGGGASALGEPSSLSRTAEITRIVALAWAMAIAGRGGGEAASAAAAINSMGMLRNALNPKW